MKQRRKAGQYSILPTEGTFEEVGTDVQLSRRVQGKLFEKHILTKGPLRHPVTGKIVNVDDEFVAKLKQNFADNVCDIVQVPLAGAQNQHTEDPDRNLGEVVDIVERDGKVYARIDARKNASDFGKTLLGASAMLHTNYVDTRTGKAVGPTLLHVAVTNRPYVVGLEDYKEVLAASNVAESAVVMYPADALEVQNPSVESLEDDSTKTINTLADNSDDETALSSASSDVIQETTMTLDEMLSALKAEHGLDVPALQAELDDMKTQIEEKTSLSNELATSLAALLKDTETVALSAEGEEVSNDVIVGAIAELANTNKVYHAKVEKLELSAAQTEVEALVTQGRVLPTQVESLVELKLSNPSMFDKIVPAQPVVKMNVAIGSDTLPDDQKHEMNIDDEITRLTQLAQEAK